MSEYKELIIMILVTAVIFSVGGYFIGNTTKTAETASMQKSIYELIPDTGHDHGEIEVADNADVPSVEIEVTKDETSGYNIKLALENYKFTPNKVGSDPIDNEGHAHLYINGKKVMRVYSTSFYLPDYLLAEGENDITVTLNANDHSDWTVNGEHISASQLVE